MSLEARIARANLVYNEPVKRSEEGMPLGNGRMGTLVWTTPTEIRMQINRVDVYANNSYTNSFFERNNDYCGGCAYLDIDLGEAARPAFEEKPPGPENVPQPEPALTAAALCSTNGLPGDGVDCAPGGAAPGGERRAGPILARSGRDPVRHGQHRGLQVTRSFVFSTRATSAIRICLSTALAMS